MKSTESTPFDSSGTTRIRNAVFDANPEAILVTSPEGMILDYNSSFLELWGIPQEVIRSGQKRAGIEYVLGKVAKREDFEAAAELVRQNDRTETHDLVSLKDGRLIERHSRPLLQADELVGRIWFYRDVSDLKSTENKLENSLALLRGVFEKSMDGILVVDNEKKVLDFNENYLEIWNMDPDFLVNGSYHEVIEYSLSQVKEMEKMKESIYSLISSPAAEGFALIEFKDGRIVERFTKVLKVKGEIAGRILFYRDITERTQRVNELIRKNYELDSFVYRASHDLKAPLNSIQGLVNLINMVNEDERVAKYLGMMGTSVDKLDTFIRNLAEFSQNEQLELAREQINLQALLDDLIESLEGIEHFDRVRLESQVNGGVDFVSDPVRLRIILANVLSNAIKYQDLECEDAQVSLSVDVSPQEAIIEVRDNGIGIEQDHQAKVFDLFFRGSIQSFGSGLGLYITRNAIEKLGGSIELRSWPGQGSTFVLRIPNAHKHQASATG